MVKPKKNPMGDEYIPGEEGPGVREPQKKRLPKEDPEKHEDQELPPDPDQPDAPVKK